MANGTEVAGEKFSARAVDVDKILPHNLGVACIASIGYYREQFMRLRVFVERGEMVIAEEN